MDDFQSVFVSVIKEEDVKIEPELPENCSENNAEIKQKFQEDYSKNNTEFQIKQEYREDYSENDAEENSDELEKFCEVVVNEIPVEYATENETQPCCAEKCVQKKDIEQLEARVGRLECLLGLLVSKITSSKSIPHTTTSSSSLSVKKPIIRSYGHPLTSSSTHEAETNTLKTNSEQSNTKEPTYMVITKNAEPSRIKPLLIVDVNKSDLTNLKTSKSVMSIPGVIDSKSISAIPPSSDGNKLVHSVVERKSSSSIQTYPVFRKLLTSTISTESGSMNVKTSNSMKSVPKVIAPKPISAIPFSLNGNQLVHPVVEGKLSSSIQQSSVSRKVVPSTIATKSIPASAQCSDADNLGSVFKSINHMPATLQYLHARGFDSAVIETQSVPTIPSGFVFDESEPVNVDTHRSNLVFAAQVGCLKNVNIELMKQPNFEQVVKALLVASSGIVVKALCSHFPEVVHSMEASRTLFFAAEFDRIEILKALLEAGTNPNARNRNSLTVLHKAASRDNEICIRILLHHGANISATTNCRCTALHMAAMSGATKCITALLENGASIDEPDNMGCTALHYAVRCKQPKAVQILLKAGANQKFENLQGKTPFDLQCLETSVRMEVVHRKRRRKVARVQGNSMYSKINKTEKRTNIPQPESSKTLKNHNQPSEQEPEKKKKKFEFHRLITKMDFPGNQKTLVETKRARIA